MFCGEVPPTLTGWCPEGGHQSSRMTLTKLATSVSLESCRVKNGCCCGKKKERKKKNRVRNTLFNDKLLFIKGCRSVFFYCEIHIIISLDGLRLARAH